MILPRKADYSFFRRKIGSDLYAPTSISQSTSYLLKQLFFTLAESEKKILLSRVDLMKKPGFNAYSAFHMLKNKYLSSITKEDVSNL